MNETKRKLSIVFVSNFINHHQVHVADLLANHEEVDYHFIMTTPMPEWILKSGYADYSDREYIVKTFTDEKNDKFAKELINNADIVFFSCAPEKLLQKRLREGKLTFHHSERWFKNGFRHFIDPRTYIFIAKHHFRYRNKNSYMLCYGGFTASDCNKMLCYRNKCFKWGYFTKVPLIKIENLIKNQREAKKLRLLYVARFIKWKHPEMPINLALNLKKKGLDFELNMYGSGPELSKMKNLVDKLSLNQYINFCGNISNDILIKEMRTHHILLFTSDKKEGWGAVLAEAMSNGCAVIASDKIGSVPFLIKHKETGLKFKNKNIKDLEKKLFYLYENPDKREEIVRNAYKFMQEVWSPENAAKSLLRLTKGLMNNKLDLPAEGPCSKI